ncbi:MAG: efflux RND transporter periplasmic adaptor subunit [Candidatus Omnitrophota bacterium]|jgi:multidrug efflux pump subunit AcrA (membrane-fusion protein)
MRNKKIAVYLLMLILLGGCQKEEKKAAVPDVIPVKTRLLALENIEKTIDYVGSIKASEEVLVYPKVSGKISEQIFQVGSSVAKGQPIFYIDRDEVGLKFEKAPVVSPLDGVVGKVFIDIGDHVLPQNPVALVVTLEKVQVVLDIPEIYLPKIFLGQEAVILVDAYPEQKFTGKITKISPMVNLENRAAPVEITIENPGYLLKSGMFVEVSLTLEKHIAVPVILKESIIGKEPEAYVYTVENNLARMHKVAFGIRRGSLYEVTSGLKEGDMVVIVGQQRLYEGAVVSIDQGNGNGKGEIK